MVQIVVDTLNHRTGLVALFVYKYMQLDHPQRNIQIDQIKVAFSMNTMAAEGLVVKLEVGKLWDVAWMIAPPQLPL